MISRVTQQTMQHSSLNNLQRNLQTLNDLQAKMSSGKNFTRASEDPGAANRSMTLRSEQAAVAQAKRSADDGAGWLAQIDSALQTSISLLQRARDLTVRGSNDGAGSTESREAIAVELEGLRDALIDAANTRLNGRSLFAGTSNASRAYEGPTSAQPYTWNGHAGSTVERRLGQDVTVRVDADGLAAFGQGANSVFALMDTIAGELRAGNNVTTHLADIDARIDGMLNTVTDVGVRHKQVLDAQNSLKLDEQNLRAARTGIEDIDLAQIVMELQMQEVAYQGALGATARVLQPSLMDFLR